MTNWRHIALAYLILFEHRTVGPMQRTSFILRHSCLYSLVIKLENAPCANNSLPLFSMCHQLSHHFHQPAASFPVIPWLLRIMHVLHRLPRFRCPKIRNGRRSHPCYAWRSFERRGGVGCCCRGHILGTRRQQRLKSMKTIFGI